MDPVAATPLPANLYHPAAEKEWHKAFNSCKRLEANDSRGQQQGSKDPQRRASCVVAARVLGYALKLAPSDEGRNFVSRSVNSCDDEPELLVELAHILIFYMIRIFRNPNGPSPNVSADASPRPLFEADIQSYEKVSVATDAAPVSLRRKVLARDRYACMFTGRLDLPSIMNALISENPGRLAEPLQMARIISQSLTSDIEVALPEARDKFEWASTAATVLSCFAGVEIKGILPGYNTHHPANAITASFGAHSTFDQLDLWLTPLVVNGQNIPNAYRTNLANPRARRAMGLLPEVRLEAVEYNGEVIPPPSATLLALHAACAQIAHLSGAAEVLDKLYEEREELHGLSSHPLDMSYNPSGAAALEEALYRAQAGVLR